MVGFTRNNMKWPNLDASKKVKHGTTSVFSTNSQVTEMLIQVSSPYSTRVCQRYSTFSPRICSNFMFIWVWFCEKPVIRVWRHHEMLVVMDVAKPLAHRYWPIPIDVDNHNILRSVWWLNPHVCSLNCLNSFIFHWTNKSLNFSKSTISFLPQVSKNRNFSVFSVLWTVEHRRLQLSFAFARLPNSLRRIEGPFLKLCHYQRPGLPPRQARQGCPKPQQEREPWPCIDLDINIYTVCVYIYTYIWYV